DRNVTGVQTCALPISGSDVHLNLQTYLAGLRAARPAGRLIEFGQVLAGAARASGSVFDVTTASTHFAVQAGAGLDYSLTRRLSRSGERRGGKGGGSRE